MKATDKKLVLHAGDFYFDQAGTQMHTLLGSCIAITLWHPQRRIGGMCHFALPRPDNLQRTRLDARYAEDSLLMFERAVRKAGTELSEYQGKIFGGGNMYSYRPPELESIQLRPVGDKNVAMAYRLLIDAGIPIQVAHVGQSGSRRIIFDLATGDVWVRFTQTRTVQRISAEGHAAKIG